MTMMTSSNGNIFRVTGPLCGEFTGPGEFPTQRPVTRSFGVFFDLRLNKRLSKQPWGWWFETPALSLWRHRNDPVPVFSCALWDEPRLNLDWAYVWTTWQLTNLRFSAYPRRAWRRHQMKTFSALLALCAGNSPVTAQRPTTRNFDVFFDLCLNKRLRQQPWGWWFETPSQSWPHRNGNEWFGKMAAWVHGHAHWNRTFCEDNLSQTKPLAPKTLYLGHA